MSIDYPADKTFGSSNIKLSTFQKIGFGSGDVAVNISMMSISLMATYFYTDIFGIKLEHMAFMFFIARFIDAFTDPLMGWITDKVNMNQGRYRPWFGIAAIPFGFSIYMLFMTPELSYQGKLIWAYATYIFNTLAFTVVTIPYISLIGVITDDPKERLSANGFRFVMAKVAVLFVTSTLTIMATYFGDGDKAAGFSSAMGIMAIISSLALIFCFFTTKERVHIQVESIPLKEQIKHLFANDQWRILASVCVAMMIGFLLRGSISFHYATYYLNITNELLFATFMSMWAVGGILASIVSTWLTKYYCKVDVFKYSMYLAALVGFIMFFVVEPNDIYLGIVFYFVLCFLSDLNTPIFWSSISEVVDYGELKVNKRVSGITFGSISFLQKLGMGIAGMMVGLLLSFFDYQPNQVQTNYTLTGISLMLTILPAIFFLITGLLVSKFVISNEYYNTVIRPKLA